jgi:hypothetical protein
MIPLPEYVKIKDNYCIVYFGNCKEYIVQLRLLRPIMEKTFAGLQVYLACKDEYMYLLNNESKTLSASSLKTQKQKFAYIREIYTEINKHPVEELMLESEIPFQPICNNTIHPELIKGSCLLLTTANPPTRSLNANQITHALDYIRKQGCQAHLNKRIDDFDWVVGVENENLYEAASQGKKVTLIPTGFGENLFKKMFPASEILRIPVSTA